MVLLQSSAIRPTLLILSFVMLCMSMSFAVVLPPNVCGALIAENETYTMAHNVTGDDTCFTVVANNVTLDCAGYTIYYANASRGYGVNVTGYNFTTIENCTIVQANDSNTDSHGIFLSSSSNSTLAGNTATASGDSSYGILLDSSSDNNVTGSSFSSIYLGGSDGNNFTSNNVTGIQIALYSSDNNTFVSNNLICTAYCLIVSSSSSNTFSSNNITGSDIGVRLIDGADYNSLTSNSITVEIAFAAAGVQVFSDHNTFAGNNISSAGGNGLEIYSGQNNTFYDNLINGTTPVFLSSAGENLWNTTNHSGTNIIGGNLIGGNFYATQATEGNPFGTGFSHDCTDADWDGICDSNYTIDSNNIDYLPLAMPLTCGMSLDLENYTYIMTQDVNASGTCFTIGADNVTLNCNGHTINHSQSTDGYGVDIGSHIFATVKNCNIVQSVSGPDPYGIVLGSGSGNSTIKNNNITSTEGFCISLSSSSGSTIRNNILTSVDGYGITLSDGSSGNSIYNNSISASGTGVPGNAIAGIYLEASSDSNNATDNNVTVTDGFGVYITDSSVGNSFARNNVTSTGSNIAGFYLESDANNNTFMSNTITSAYSVFITSSSNNTFTNNNVTGSDVGIYLRSDAVSSDYNTFTGNTITSANGIFIIAIFAGSDNLFYNNLINSSNPVTLSNAGVNYWNTTLALLGSGTNIAGGPFIGGNAYVNSLDTGFSQTCADADRDGICDSNYTFDESNIDYLPLAMLSPYVGPIGATASDEYGTDGTDGSTVCAGAVDGPDGSYCAVDAMVRSVILCGDNSAAHAFIYEDGSTVDPETWTSDQQIDATFANISAHAVHVWETNGVDDINGGFVTRIDVVSPDGTNTTVWRWDDDGPDDAVCAESPLTVEFGPLIVKDVIVYVDTNTVTDDWEEVDFISLSPSPPSITSIGATTSGSTVTLSVTTDNTAECRYSTSDTSFFNMTVMSSTNSTSHSKPVTFSSSASGTYYVRCRGLAGDAMNTSNSTAFSITISGTTYSSSRTCTASWSCTAFSSCSATGVQTRTCTDLNNCGTTAGKPDETQTCAYVAPCTESWSCTDYGACGASGYQSRVCTDTHSCGTSSSKPSELQQCTYTAPSPLVIEANATEGGAIASIPSIAAGETETVSMTQQATVNTGVTSIVLYANNALTNVTLTINTVEAPANVTAPNDTVIIYLNISATNINGNLDKAVINFQVSKSKVNDVTKVRLAHYTNGAWVTLPTVYTGETGTNYNFQAETPGFSYFAVIEEKATAAVPPPSEQQPLISPQTQQPAAGGSNFGLIVLVFLILAAAAYWWYGQKNQQKR